VRCRGDGYEAKILCSDLVDALEAKCERDHHALNYHAPGER